MSAGCACCASCTCCGTVTAVARGARVHAVGRLPAARDAGARGGRAAARAPRPPAAADRRRPRLVEHADAVIARLELAEAELAAATGDEVAGRVRVAAFQTAASSLVLPLLGALAAEHPGCAWSWPRWRRRRRSTCCRAARSTSWSPRSTTTRRARDPSLSFTTSAATRSSLVLPADHPLCAADPGDASSSPRSATSLGVRRARARRSTTRSTGLPGARRASSPTAATVPTTSRCSSSSSRPARRRAAPVARTARPRPRRRGPARRSRGAARPPASSSPRGAAAPSSPGAQGRLARAARAGARGRRASSGPGAR